MSGFLHLDGVTPFEGFSASIQVFLIDLDRVQQNAIFDPGLVLSVEELAQAEKFATAELKKRFVSRRWVLRTILSDYCRIEPQALQLQREENGKPFVIGRPVQFSFSHSRGNAAIAIAESGLIGIDIEGLPSIETCTEVADRLLTANEAKGMPVSRNFDYRKSFLRYWTIKESIIKATGEGLSRDLHDIELNTVNQQPVLSKLPASYGQTGEWVLRNAYLDDRQSMLALAYRNKAN